MNIRGIPAASKRLLSSGAGYIGKRVGQTVLTFLTVYTLSFSLVLLGQGTPFGETTPEHAAWQAASLAERYVLLLSEYLQGNFGQSAYTGSSVFQEIAAALPWTLLVFASATFLALTTGALLGVVMVYYEGRWPDVVLSSLVIMLRSIPGFIIAVLLLTVVFYDWGVFSRGGAYTIGTQPGFNVPFVLGVVEHAVLPILAAALAHFSGALGMRASGIRVLGEPYVRAARMRGLSGDRIALNYIGWNSVLPVYTSLIVSFVELLGSSLVIEVVFFYPGLGTALWRAAENSDFSLLAGIVFTLGVITAGFVLLADLCYVGLDPRIEDDGDGSNKTTTRRPLAPLRRWLARRSADTSERELPGDIGSRLRRANGSGQIAQGDTLDRDARTRERFRRMVWEPTRLVWRDWRGKVGIVLLSCFGLTGVFGPRLIDAPSAYISTPEQGPRYLQPLENLEFPLGTDYMGRSMFEMLVNGTGTMLAVVLAGAVVAMVAAVIVGVTTGYTRGLVGSGLTALGDIVLTIPGFPVVYAVMPIFGISSPTIVAGLLGLTYWGGAARDIRSQVLAVRQETYVEASRTMGLSSWWVATRDLLPSVAPYALMKFVESLRYVMISLVALYFLGAFQWGREQPWMLDFNWGVMIYRAWSQQLVLVNPNARHVLFLPLAAVMLVLLGASFLAQAMDQVLNVRLQQKKAGVPEDVDEAE